MVVRQKGCLGNLGVFSTPVVGAGVVVARLLVVFVVGDYAA